MKKLLLSTLFLTCWVSSYSQYKPHGTGDLLQGLEKLKVVGSAMYIAAHPDDENTLMITWLANEKKVRTAYIAMTRGDGGQNLLGTEKGEFAGLLRTNELLGARSIDGGEQYFTRANDFGYCKSTEEALATWNEEKVFSDLVYRIRKFKPDVMITRFPPDERAGHGHHSASSLLAEKAFDAAADPTVFPEQVKETGTWQAKRLVWNFYNRGFTNTPPEDDSQFIQVDIGGYNPYLGASYGEIGSSARSMHKSQGFGARLFRGERMEVLKHTKGEPAENDLFDGINTHWSRIKGGEIVETYINDIIRDFDATHPENSVLALLQLKKYMESLPSETLVENKKKELDEIILEFAGIHVEVIADDFAYAPGDSLKASVEITNRGELKASLKEISLRSPNVNWRTNTLLSTNKSVSVPVAALLSEDFDITQPYWLKEEHPIGYYNLSNESFRNLPHSPAPVEATLSLDIEGQHFEKSFEVKYKYVEPSFGEIYRPLEIRPEITLTSNLNSLVFSSMIPQEILVTAKAASSNVKGKISLRLPDGWSCFPAYQTVSLENKYDEALLNFNIVPSKTGSKGTITIEAEVNGHIYDRSLNSIKYQHIPEITTFPKAQISALKLDLKKKGKTVGYIMGAGDEVPTALEQMGYQVKLLAEDDLNKPLKEFDAILIGVRAYNTKDWLHFYHEKLMKFVEEGGNLICQYQTRGRWADWQNSIGPYPLEIGRDRVSQEDAEVRFVDPGSPVLNTPNKITSRDFDGWVQERGLYFASSWGEQFKPVLSMNDTGEDEKLGSLLYAPYGKGNYIFTGLSFFRELPAGVPGAYRLMANLISL